MALPHGEGRRVPASGSTRRGTARLNSAGATRRPATESSSGPSSIRPDSCRRRTGSPAPANRGVCGPGAVNSRRLAGLEAHVSDHRAAAALFVSHRAKLPGVAGAVRPVLSHGRSLASRGPEDIKTFLDALALDQRLSASSQRQALNAVVFLLREVFGRELGDFSDYRRARLRPHAPAWLTRTELQALLDQLEGRWALMTQVAFGGGLRLMELLRLRVKDVDLEQEIITVRAGKGDKDRFVPLAHTAAEPLRAHLREVRRIYESDRSAQVAGVWLPEGLARKYPKAGEEWPWFWVWPEAQLSWDPRGGVQRRHHVSDRAFQRAIKTAAWRAGLNKRVTPHVLRHSFASQMVDAGYDIRTVQELFGHRGVETTQIYTHVMRRPGLRVRSPSDNVEGKWLRVE